MKKNIIVGINNLLRKVLIINSIKILSSIIIIFYCTNSYAQTAINIGAQKTIGGYSVDEGVSLSRIGSGYVTLIKSRSDISFDRNVSLYGVQDYWLVRLNANLQPIWQKAFGGSNVEEANDMIVTESNDIIIVGFSESSQISGNKTIPNYGVRNIWVVCTDSIGNIKWQKVYGGSPGENYYVKIIQTLDGNFIIGTSSCSSVSGTKTDSCRGKYDYWLFSIDSLGNQLWDKTIGGTGFDILGDMVQISDSNIAIVGTSNSPISGEKTEDTIASTNDPYDDFGGRDLWLVNYNFITNSIVWDKTIGGKGEEEINPSLVFKGGYFYISSSTSSGISGTKTCASFGSLDIWINKIALDGSIIWDKAFGGSNQDLSSSIKVIGSSSLLVGGSSLSPISGNKSENVIGGSDYWFFEINTSGNINWDKTIGGNNTDILTDIFINSNNSFLAIGSSISSATGYKTEDIRGSIVNRRFDAWIVEISTSTNILSNYENMLLNLYPNPTTTQLNITLKSPHKSIRQLQITDLQGKKILQKQINAKQTKLDVSNLSKGVYILEGLTNTGEIFSRNFVKE